MDARQLFIEVVSNAAELPAELAAHAAGVRACERLSFDETYLEFLDTQIRLSPRGPEWTERLTRRRAGLAPFCGATLIRGDVRTAAVDYTVYVDPDHRRIVYWEQYDMDGGAA